VLKILSFAFETLIADVRNLPLKGRVQLSINVYATVLKEFKRQAIEAVH